MTSWRSRASCLDEDPELFFPPGQGSQLQPQILAARRICAGCSVRPQCLEYALKTQQNEGIWGGLTADERAAQRRAQRANATSSVANAAEHVPVPPCSSA
jgi:WhiB family transcriptional regulator, redox-sensing transcriptional regulator